jgi:hypothetical protein
MGQLQSTCTASHHGGARRGVDHPQTDTPAVVVQVDPCEQKQQILKPFFHFIGSRVETRRFQAMGLTNGFNLYSPTPPAAKPAAPAAAAPAATAAPAAAAATAAAAETGSRTCSERAAASGLYTSMTSACPGCSDSGV